MSMAFYVSILIFSVAYAIIISEKIHRTIVALAGGMLMIMLGLISQETALKEDIDFNTLGLLIGMMILVAITRRTGVFEAMAVWAARVTKGRPLALLALLILITASASALLDNVTTVLLIVPVTLTLTEKLSISPVPFLVSEIIASNIGGTATLIGDPPNIMIGSAIGLNFMDFLIHLLPIVMFIQVVTTILLMIIYRKSMVVADEDRLKLLQLSPRDEIKDWRLLKQSLAILVLTIAGFMLHATLHWESATVAMGGAALMMLVSREEPEDVLLHVEWPTIFFFAGLFVLVGGLKAAGVLNALAQWILSVTQGQVGATSFLVLWVSAVASAFVDNIPFVATMIPMLQELGQLSGMNLEPVWWSLALGSCLGGNGTLIGASANVVVAGIAEKNGYCISFKGFMFVAFPLMLVSIVLAHIYVYFRYISVL